MSAHGFPIRVPGELLEALGAHTGHFWSSLDLEPIICDMIRDYMKPAAAVPAQPPAPCEAGYQWKEVFLPEGTRLRASFDRKPYFATVQGAEIKYGEHAISPSCFANLHGSGNRNAWKAIWLRLPGSEEWLLADVCRSARKAAIARLIGGDAPQNNSENKGKQPPPHRTGANGTDGGEHARAPRQPAARQSGPSQSEPRPPRPPKTVQSNDNPPKNGSRRGGRRKRRAGKHIPGPP